MVRIGILGAGAIAGTMADTVRRMNAAGNTGVSLYAVASRSLEKAEAFAKKERVEKAFGSYEAMLGDGALDLVYVATPHSHHYGHIRICLEHGKHVLCEKAFTVNAAQAREVCALAKQKGLLLTEAIWTRYQPMRAMISDVLASGIAGEPRMLTANLGYAITGKERIIRPELAGGALLDVGVYTLNFADMLFGQPDSVQASCQKSGLGVDLQDSYTLRYKDGRMAVLCAGTEGISDRYGIIHCTKGFVQVENINNPQKISVYDDSYRLVKEIACPAQLTGYEYEVQEAAEAIEAGRTECASMPHADTVRMMELMDGIRVQFGLRYPCE